MEAATGRCAGLDRPRQPAGAHPRRCGSVPAAAPHRVDRPPLPAPPGSGRPHRGRRGRGQGPHRCGQGPPFRAVGGGSGHHPSRPCRPAGHGRAERILALVAWAGGRRPAHTRRARHRLRPVQPAWAGLPHGLADRGHDIRRLRRPQHLATVRARGKEGEPGDGRPAPRDREQKRATPAQIALAWLLAQQPWIVPIPGTRRLERLDENIGALTVDLSPDELTAIADTAALIPIEGTRRPGSDSAQPTFPSSPDDKGDR